MFTIIITVTIVTHRHRKEKEKMITATLSITCQSEGKTMRQVECILSPIECFPDGLVSINLRVESQTYNILYLKKNGKNIMDIGNKKWYCELADYDDYSWNYNSIYKVTKNDFEAKILATLFRTIPMLRQYYAAWNDKLDA